MRRPVFLSFHYDRDSARVQQIKQMGALDEQPLLSANDWEEVEKKGPTNVKNWIDNQLKYKQCTVVLVGQETWKRPWVIHEIKRSWELGKAVVGIRIHGLKSMLNNGNPEIDSPGANPFDYVSSVGAKAQLHDPVGWYSKTIYAVITTKIAIWVDEAVTRRKLYP